MLAIISILDYIQYLETQQTGQLTRHDLIRLCAGIAKLLTKSYALSADTKLYYPSDFVILDVHEERFIHYALSPIIQSIQSIVHPDGTIYIDLGAYRGSIYLFIPTYEHPEFGRQTVPTLLCPTHVSDTTPIS